jgi:CRISPR-associated protein Csb1
MLTIDRLTRAVQANAAIRRLRRLQPVGGRGDKIFPPTYPGEGKGKPPPRHVFEYRRLGGRDMLCVLVDSVQSQANRLEEALKNARDEERIEFPAITVDFTRTAVGVIGRITTLDAPHRVFDAIIRDSQLGGKPFKDTEEGKHLIQAKASNARAVFELSPTALVFGAWNSTGQGGGLGAKFPRCVVSEIIGVGVATEPSPSDGQARASGQRTGSRIDPLGIRSGVKVYKLPNGEWGLEKGKGAKEVRPSEINHSSIAPTVQSLGVSVDHVLHSFTLSCAALRRLRFSGSSGATPADVAARVALAALGLAAVVLQDENGYFLRSRCDLVLEEGQPTVFEIVLADGQCESVELDAPDAVALVRTAAENAHRAGIPWRANDLELTPQDKLVQIVLQSREKALAGEEDAAADGG